MKSLIGRRFGKLRVSSYGGKRPGTRKHRWNCQCLCGNKILIDGIRLTTSCHPTRSCGCLRHGQLVKNLTGKTFERWKVLGFHEIKNGHSLWNVRCKCGTTKVVSGASLSHGDSRSCGCLQREKAAKTGRESAIHGMTNTPEFNAWLRMKAVCYNKNNLDYADYGGRKIRVCRRWLTSFLHFLDDMGQRPSRKHSVGRKNNNGNYSPENCRWETRLEQANNKRNNVKVSWNGEHLSVAQWSRKTGINEHTIRSRIKAGWTPERILTVYP